MTKLTKAIDRLCNRVTLMLMVFLGALTLGVSGAGATPPTIPADPTGGAMNANSSRIITWVTTLGAPALFLLIGLGILIRLGVRWAKRAGRAV